jgi:hypothetical protein
MAVGVTTNTYFEQPYLTIAEYKNAPTSIDFDNLVVGGNSQAQDAELARVILRATSFMNEYLNQDLIAQQRVETQRVRMSSQGFIALHPNHSPVLSLTSFQYGSDPNGLNTLPDCSKAWFEDQQIIIPLSQLSTTYSSQGPLAFGPNIGPRTQIFTKYQYAAGYCNTTIVSATAAASSFTVADGSGFVVGDSYRIYDGASSETITVASSYSYPSTTIPTTAPLAYTHASGVAVSNLPSAVKEACIVATTAFIKLRGDNSLTMNITTAPALNAGGASSRYGTEFMIALQMIDAFRRIR